MTSTHNETVFDQLMREERDSKLHLAAQWYAMHGIPVFPVHIESDARGKSIKRPCIKDWPNQATTDPVKISSWWNGSFRGALVGGVVGYRSGWGVIDVDIKNGARGRESLGRLADELVPISSSGLVFGELSPEQRLRPVGLARTMSGGLHLWYPLGDRSKVRGRMKIRDLPGIELKATGNYVVLVPSDGYEWIIQLPEKREEETSASEWLAGLPAIDETLLNRLLDGSDDGSGGGGDGDDGVKVIIRGQGKKLLGSAMLTIRDAPEGDGNNTIYRTCCDLYPYVALGELTKVEVDQVVWAAVRGWGADEGTISGTMASAWKRTGERTLRFNTDLIPTSSSSSSSDGIDADEYEIPTALTDWIKSQIPPSDDDSHQHGDEGEVKTEVTRVVVDEDDERVPELDPYSDDVEDNDLGSLIDKTEEAYQKLLFEGFKRRVLTSDVNELYGIYSGQSNRQSWMPVDVSSTADMPTPSILRMSDGRCLLYAGEMNMIWGLASAGKTWLENLAILEAVRAGKHAILVDYENGRAKIRYRLQMIGLTDDEITRYVHVVISPTGPFPIRQFPVSLDKVGVMVIDSMTGALRSLDLDSLRGDDIETFVRNNVRPFTEAGVCALIIDHVTKNAETHDRPINSTHKLNRLQGAGYEVENIDPFVVGGEGCSWIRLWKDNGGGVGTTVSDNAGQLIIQSPGPDQPVKIWINGDANSLGALSRSVASEDTKVEKLIEDLDDAGVPDDASQRVARNYMKKNNISARASVLGKALAIRQAREEAREEAREDHRERVEGAA